jgi:uncharacterized membrane protein
VFAKVVQYKEQTISKGKDPIEERTNVNVACLEQENQLRPAFAAENHKLMEDKMSNLVVLTFEDMEQAGQALEALKKVQAEGQLKIDDAAVIVKNEAGKVEVKNQASSASKWGAFGGGVLGLLLMGVFFPLAGLAIGVASGVLIAKSLDLGVDQKFVKDVTETLKPGSSALFVIGSHANVAVAQQALTPFKGTIYQTSLDGDKLEALKDAMK